MTLGATPKLADVLGDGQATAGHVDAVTRAAAQLPVTQRGELFERVDALAVVAAASTVEQFARRVALEAKRIQADDGWTGWSDSVAAVRGSTWVDADGMWNLRGRFDPVTGVQLASKVAATVEATLRGAGARRLSGGSGREAEVPHRARTGPLIDGTAGVARAGRSEYVVVIDADADPERQGRARSPSGRSRSRFRRAYSRSWPMTPTCMPSWFATVSCSRARRVEPRSHALVWRIGPNVGPCGRVPRVCDPGCSVAYDRCKLHHIVWWRHGGPTDLDNLLPLCTKHHGKIHHDGWVIELGPNRELTLRLPDGTDPQHRTTTAAAPPPERRRSDTVAGMHPVEFDVEATDGAARGRDGDDRSRPYTTPLFMPVGTRGAIKYLSAADYERIGAQIVLGNTYHLMLRPGADVVERFGGLGRFAGWDGLTLTDSGGYQVFSLDPEGRRRRRHLQEHLRRLDASVHPGDRRRRPTAPGRRHHDGARCLPATAEPARGDPSRGRTHHGVG